MTLVLTVSRILPPGLFAGRAHALAERSALVSRHIWLLVLSGFVEPVLFLVVFGAGFQHLVGGVDGPGHRPIQYLAFVAPALLAVSAMNGALQDATFNVFGKLRSKFYETVLSTPLGVLDIALGELLGSVLRGGLYSAGFLVVMLSAGLIDPVAALCCLAAALLISTAFAATGLVATTFLRTWQDYSFVTIASTAQFLFSTTFYPLDSYPTAFRWVIEALPLTQAIQLLRGLAWHATGPALLVSSGYLAALSLAAFYWAVRRLNRKLIS